jgi:uncharacterized protein (TIGR02284 family)
MEDDLSDNDALKSLHTALIDARKGYDEAVKQAERDHMKNLFGRMADFHETAHQDLHSSLSAMGEQPDENGSFMATIHKSAIKVRATLTGLEENALSSFIDGEERNLKAYDEAIAEQGSVQTRELLRKHRENLVGAIEMMRLEESHAN